MCSPTDLLQSIEKTVYRAQALEFVVPDDTGFFAVQGSLIHQVQEIIEDALSLMRRVMDHYDETDSSDSTPDLLAGVDGIGEGVGEEDLLREIGAAISIELAAQEVSNIAFAVRAQLMETYDALKGALEGDQIWVVASHADTGLRRAGKGLITLEHTIREYEGLEPVERTWSKLHDSLEIRRLYCQFRRGISRLGTPETLEELTSGLRSAAHRIAILRDRSIYPLMRISDRIPIRRLQKRILGWLENDQAADREELGRRLWSDLQSFSELLVQVNHREELREHDRRVVREWLETHFPEELSADPMSPIPAEITPTEASNQPAKNPTASRLAGVDELAQLESLLGCSEELDDLLLRPGQRNLEDLRGPLQRIFRKLNRPFEATENPLVDL